MLEQALAGFTCSRETAFPDRLVQRCDLEGRFDAGPLVVDLVVGVKESDGGVVWHRRCKVSSRCRQSVEGIQGVCGRHARWLWWSGGGVLESSSKRGGVWRW